MKLLATPHDETLELVIAVVQPLPWNQVPLIFQSIFSMSIAPSMITNVFSPWLSGYFYCNLFMMVYKCWSATMTGIWPRFRWSVTALAIPVAWYNSNGLVADSLNNGSMKDGVIGGISTV